MFGSEVLDIALGLVFVYLLLSLICSAINEIIEGWLKNRSVKLEQGLRELLADPDGTGYVQRLYSHPLISSLFRGQYNPAHMTGVGAFFRRLFGRVRLPSYIPSQNFALALMDIILPGAQAPAAGAQAPAAGAQTAAVADVSARRSGAAASTKARPATPPIVVNLGAPPPPAAADDGDALQDLRRAIVALPNAQVRQALITLVDAAGNDVAKARENIENWFNGSMDRISSWYKRRSQAIILLLGFAIAIAMNADTVYIVRALANDPALRNTLVAAADNYAKVKAAETDSATPTPTPALSQSSSSVSPNSAAGSAQVPQSQPGPRGTNAPSPTPLPSSLSSVTSVTPATSPKSAPSMPALPACVKDENSPDCRFAKTRAEIQKLGLPIGWDSEDDIYRQWPGNHWKRTGGWWQQVYRHWLGWLITAMAISLGAPFWFDLLNKFIVIRSTVKPREKSQEEKSKD